MPAASANVSIMDNTARYFAAKKKRTKKNPEDPSASDTEVELEEAPKAAEPVRAAPKLSGGVFSVGDVKRIDTTPDHKPPSMEDTIEGRYAAVLFTTASQKSQLFNVFEDMRYLSELYKSSESFRLFTENGGVGAKEIRLLNKALTETAPFSETTLHFLTILAENKRLVFIKDIAEKYEKLYQQFNREEKITIISAVALDSKQQGQVLEALKANPQNEGKEFTIEYQVDSSIMGGLQMYTESEFMDMSLVSRVDRLRQEVDRMSQ